MSDFSDENQEFENELYQSLSRQILPFLQQGILQNEQFNLILNNIPLIRNDTFIEEEGNSRLFPISRVQQVSNRLSSREKPQNIQKYLKKRTIPIQNNKFDPKQPHIKITQLRNLNKNHEYFVNELGLVDSQKNTNSLDILIGRQDRQRQDIIPNDIILPEVRTVSRIHCKIVYNDFFRKTQIINPIYEKLLKQIRLPLQIKQRISQFLEKPKIVQIQDLGSICGTYLRIFREKPFILQKDQKFSIGCDTYFNIIFYHKQNTNLKQIDDVWYTAIRNLSNQKQPLKHQIHFNDLVDFTYIQEPLDQELECCIDDIYKILSEYQLPILIVKFQGQGVDINKSINLFVGKLQLDSNDFFIGRGFENSIKIHSNTISRKQCRIKYSNKFSAWIINDGSEDRDSANGTWSSLQTEEQSEKKLESNLIEIHHNDEIKISDFVLKLEFENGTKEGISNKIKKFLHD